MTSFSEMHRQDGVSNTKTRDDPEEAAGSWPEGDYQAPSLTYLGTLRELTLGGSTGPDDAVGGGGGIGSF
jgi:hypothetical protein